MSISVELVYFEEKTVAHFRGHRHRHLVFSSAAGVSTGAKNFECLSVRPFRLNHVLIYCIQTIEFVYLGGGYHRRQRP